VDSLQVEPANVLFSSLADGTPEVTSLGLDVSWNSTSLNASIQATTPEPSPEAVSSESSIHHVSRERKILEDCASAYLHGAYIYFLCRREGLVGFTIAFKGIRLSGLSDGLHLIQRSNSTGKSSTNFWTQGSCPFLVDYIGPFGLWFQHSSFASHARTRRKGTPYEKDSFKIFTSQEVIV